MKIKGIIYKETLEIGSYIVLLLIVAPLLQFMFELDISGMFRVNIGRLLGPARYSLAGDVPTLLEYYQTFHLKYLHSYFKRAYLNFFPIVSYSLPYALYMTKEVNTGYIKVILKTPVSRLTYAFTKHIFYSSLILVSLLLNAALASYLIYGTLYPQVILLIKTYLPHIILVTSLAFLTSSMFSNEMATVILPYILYQIISQSITPFIFSYDQYSMIKGVEPYYSLNMIDKVRELFGDSNITRFLINVESDLLPDAIRYANLMYMYIYGIAIITTVISLILISRRDYD